MNEVCILQRKINTALVCIISNSFFIFYRGISSEFNIAKTKFLLSSSGNARFLVRHNSRLLMYSMFRAIFQNFSKQFSSRDVKTKILSWNLKFKFSDRLIESSCSRAGALQLEIVATVKKHIPFFFLSLIGKKLFERDSRKRKSKLKIFSQQNYNLANNLQWHARIMQSVNV